MKILLLGPDRPEFVKFLESFGDEVRREEASIKPDSPCLDDVAWLVSYGYRHIIPEGVINRFPKRIVNLHISYLPWNRGADPNLWSFIDKTPKGVTIHFIDAGVDTGDIIAQEPVVMHEDDTLRTSYARLAEAIERLFRSHWSEIRAGRLVGAPQPPGGSEHRLRDKKKIEHLLSRGHDTPVSELADPDNRVGRDAGRSGQNG